MMQRRWRTDTLRMHAVVMAIALIAGVCALGRAAQSQSPDPNESDVATADAPRRVAVRFLTEGDFPPFNFYDEDGVLTGFNVDLARALCLEIGAACDIRVRPWEALLPALKRGEADAVIASHTVGPDALSQADFTDRYFFTPGRFATRRDESPVEATPEGLDGMSIGVARGTAHEAYAKAFFQDSSIVPFESSDLAREALMQTKVDLIFEDAISLSFWLNGTNSQQCCEFRGGPYLEPSYFGEGVAIAVPKNDPQIRKLINEALKRVRDNGRMEELMQRYFPYKIY